MDWVDTSKVSVVISYLLILLVNESPIKLVLSEHEEIATTIIAISAIIIFLITEVLFLNNIILE
jgi:hypothetical protein